MTAMRPPAAAAMIGAAVAAAAPKNWLEVGGETVLLAADGAVGVTTVPFPPLYPPPPGPPVGTSDPAPPVPTAPPVPAGG